MSNNTNPAWVEDPVTLLYLLPLPHPLPLLPLLHPLPYCTRCTFHRLSLCSCVGWPADTKQGRSSLAGP